MATIFKIIEVKETGETFLAKPYWLDPSNKWALFAEYKECKEPVFKESGLGMIMYRSEIKIIGEYKTEKVSVNDRNYLTFNINS